MNISFCMTYFFYSQIVFSLSKQFDKTLKEMELVDFTDDLSKLSHTAKKRNGLFQTKIAVY